MISKSALKAKINRSGVKLNKTFLSDHIETVFDVKTIIDLFLSKDEEVLLIYHNENDNWILTSKRLIIPKDIHQILIGDMKKVDFDDIKEEKSSKKENTALYIHLKKGDKYKINVEDRTWFLFYDIFKWVINKNKLK